LGVTLEDVALSAKATTTKKPKSASQIVIRSKKQVLVQSRILITALEMAVAYDPLTQHNQSKPELYVDLGLDKVGALNDIKELIAELKKLNGFLATLKKPTKYDEQNVIDLRKHLNTFLNAGAVVTGGGAGLMMLGLVSSLLYHIGGKEVVDFALAWKCKP
jgi:hypothetical protein